MHMYLVQVGFLKKKLKWVRFKTKSKSRKLKFVDGINKPRHFCTCSTTCKNTSTPIVYPNKQCVENLFETRTCMERTIDEFYSPLTIDQTCIWVFYLIRTWASPPPLPRAWTNPKFKTLNMLFSIKIYYQYAL